MEKMNNLKIEILRIDKSKSIISRHEQKEGTVTLKISTTIGLISKIFDNPRVSGLFSFHHLRLGNCSEMHLVWPIRNL